MAGAATAVVERLHKGLQGLVKKHKIEFIRGVGRVVGHTKVEIELLDDEFQPAGTRSLDATDVILATRQPREEPARARARRHGHRHQRRHPAQ